MNFKRLASHAGRAAVCGGFCLTHPKSLFAELPHVLRNRARGATPLGDALPWIPFAAIEWLNATLQPAWRVFEYGSGGSTLFLASRVAHVTSVEHIADWHARVESAFPGALRERVTLLLAPPESGTHPEYASEVEQFRGMNFRRYAAAIDEIPDASLDLVLVDGRARFACVRHALPKIRPGGWLVLDNSEREKYRALGEFLRAYPRRDFEGLNPYQIDPGRTSAWRIGEPSR